MSGETETRYGVTLEPYVHESGGSALKAGGYSPTVCESWIRVTLAGVILYDGPIHRFDPDYLRVEQYVGGMIPEFQQRLSEHIIRDLSRGES